VSFSARASQNIKSSRQRLSPTTQSELFGAGWMAGWPRRTIAISSQSQIQKLVAVAGSQFWVRSWMESFALRKIGSRKPPNRHN